MNQPNILILAAISMFSRFIGRFRVTLRRLSVASDATGIHVRDSSVGRHFCRHTALSCRFTVHRCSVDGEHAGDHAALVGEFARTARVEPAGPLPSCPSDTNEAGGGSAGEAGAARLPPVHGRAPRGRRAEPQHDRAYVVRVRLGRGHIPRTGTVQVRHGRNPRDGAAHSWRAVVMAASRFARDAEARMVRPHIRCATTAAIPVTWHLASDCPIGPHLSHECLPAQKLLASPAF
jgi:hypothetical protein